MAVMQPGPNGGMGTAPFNQVAMNDTRDGLPPIGFGGRRTLTRQGRVIAAQSPPPPSYLHDQYYARARYVGVTWTGPAQPTPAAFPADLSHDNGSGQAAVDIVWDRMIGTYGASEGELEVWGFNGGNAGDTWYVMLQATNSEYTAIFPPAGSFHLLATMTGQAIIDVNNNYTTLIEGAVQAPRNDNSYVSSFIVRVR